MIISAQGTCPDLRLSKLALQGLSLVLLSAMKIPENPKNPGPFEEQYGYKEIKVKMQKYHDKPTPTSAKQSKAQEFISSKTDKAHQKKYAKKVFDVIVRSLCK